MLHSLDDLNLSKCFFYYTLVIYALSSYLTSVITINVHRMKLLLFHP